MSLAARRLLPVALLAVLALVAGCSIGPSRRPALAVSGGTTAAAPTTAASGTAPSSRPLGPGGPGTDEPPIDWGRCPDDLPATAGSGSTAVTLAVECGLVAVPYDRSDPGSGSFDLQVTRGRAEGVPESAPPLLVVLGEPGENGTYRIASVAAALPQAVRDAFTLVTVDVRGTGGGWDPPVCFDDSLLQDLLAPLRSAADPQDAGTIAAASRTAVFDCADTERTRITDVSTTAAADDLDAVRSALGQQTLRLLGQGWGATLAAVYVDRFPGRVTAAVIDSPADPTATAQQLVGRRADALQDALDVFADDCRSRSGCPLGEDPAARVRSTVQNLGDSGTAGDSLYLSGGSVLLELTSALGDPDSWPAVADAVAALDREDGKPLEQLLLARSSRQDETLLQAQLEYRCNDTAVRADATAMRQLAEQAARTAPDFGPFLAGQLGLCAAWPTSTAAIGRLSGTGAPPVLVTGATGDPVAPYAGVRAVSSQLSSAVLVSWQASAHGAVTGSDCVAAIAAEYLTGRGAPPDGRLCPP